MNEAPFEWQPQSIEQELARCQRYCIEYDGETVSTGVVAFGFSYANNASTAYPTFPVAMRTTPTFTVKGGGVSDWNIGGQACTSIALSSETDNHVARLNCGVAGTPFNVQNLQELQAGNGSALFFFDAEL